MKSQNVLLYALLTSLTGFTLDTILPSVPDIAASVSNPHNLVAPLVITTVIFGMVFGEIIFGPLSDAVGRKPAILIGIALFMIGTTTVLCANSFEQVLIGRALQGVGIAGPKIGTRALIRDQYSGADMARIMSLIFSILIFIPMIAPLVGKTINDIYGWPGPFWFLALLGTGAMVWLTFGQDETLPENRRQKISIISMVKNFRLILKHRRVVSYTIIAGLIFSIQLFFLSVAISIFDQSFNRVDSFVYWFALIAISMAAGSLLNSRLVKFRSMEWLVERAVTGLFAIGATLLMFTNFSSSGVSFFIFIAAMMAVFLCIGIIFGNINAMAMVYLGRIAGFGASFIASFSSLIAFIVAALFGQFNDGSPQLLSLLIFLSGIIAFLLLRFSNSAKSSQAIL